MIPMLMDFLKFNLVKTPAVFSYYSVRMMLAALTSLLLVIFLGPKFIRAVSAIKKEHPTRTEDCALLIELHGKEKHSDNGRCPHPFLNDCRYVTLDGAIQHFYFDPLFNNTCFWGLRSL